MRPTRLLAGITAGATRNVDFEDLITLVEMLDLEGEP
jgi:hypothetical protein